MGVRSYLSASYRYLERLSFVFNKIKPNLLYATCPKNLRDKNHKLREVLHAIDKAKKLNNFDEKRIERRVDVAKSLMAETDVSLENEKLSSILSLTNNQKVSEFDVRVEIPTIRHYSDIRVNEEDVYKSLHRAARSPRSCSRDSISVKIFRNSPREQLNKFSGPTGFEFGYFELLVIVVDLRAYDQRAEFFAPYIDGAIFATSLCERLWEHGIGSCMLNWSSQTKKNEKDLRESCGLNRYEAVVMGITIGSPAFIPFHAPRAEIEKFAKVVK